MNEIKYLIKNEISTKDEFIKAVMDKLHYIGCASVHNEDEDGNITNYCFYFNNENTCPELVYESDFRGLCENGERYLSDEIRDEPITEEEIVKILSDDSYYWRNDWCNVDCDF